MSQVKKRNRRYILEPTDYSDVKLRIMQEKIGTLSVFMKLNGNMLCDPIVPQSAMEPLITSLLQKEPIPSFKLNDTESGLNIVISPPESNCSTTNKG